jgi:two-component system, OmpR family, sensor kinase
VNRFQDQLKEHQLTTRVAPTPGTWDRLRVEQVVTNLLSNAIKYGEGLPIEILLEGDDRTVCLSVKDHGIGIEPEHQDRLFERFERAVTRPQYGGFGLGLWITRQIVHAMEGHIAVESRPGEGSTFRVTLPRQPIRMAAHAKEAARS